MPEELRERLAECARTSERSLNKEIIHRLEASLEASPEPISPAAGASPTGAETSRRRLVERRPLVVLTVLAAVLAAVLGGITLTSRTHSVASLQAKLQSGEQRRSSQSGATGNGDESARMLQAQTEFDQQRTAPTGVVDPAGYQRGFGALTGLAPAGGPFTELTGGNAKPVAYDSDDPRYRDYFSNSGGGSGLVTGRITGIAADASGDVYAGGANGGVWRSTAGGGNWTPIADALPSLSTGTLQLGPDKALWYGTGEANTGSTAYVGAGVYRLPNPKTGAFEPSNKVGGDELDGSTIGALRFGGGRVWAATSRGIWSHSLTGSLSAPWSQSFAPNPGDLSGTPGGYAKNIVNDIAIDPNDANHIIAAVGWRSGDSYNGFYETHNANAAQATWVKINPTGAIPANDIGYVTFAWASDGSKLYAINESPTLLNKLTGTVNSYLDGIYVSSDGSIAGPWSKIADSQKLANSGSALKQSIGGKGYGPGIQAWYNQFLAVDPQNSNHIYAGLEEVYESTNGGSNWNTVGPYWNFNFPCWTLTTVYPPDGTSSCSQTTHSDQHSVAFGTDASGKRWLYVGNDGGIYRRPVAGSVDASGHATDWQSLNDGTIDALQYYSVSAGLATSADLADAPLGTKAGDPIVSGGMQDNGGSIWSDHAAKMSSDFGGDGGDSLVDPANGCNIVQEYVNLTMEVTNLCAHSTDPQQFINLSIANTRSISPPDVSARFIAPFTADNHNLQNWLAGGSNIWFQTKGFAIKGPNDWTSVYHWDNAGEVTTALGYSGNAAIAAYCGPCNSGGFVRGAAVGTYNPATGTWTWTRIDADIAASGVPNRYISGVAVDPANPRHLVIVASGFSRRFAIGPGSGDNHVFESTDGGSTWHALDGPAGAAGFFPDIPTNSVAFTPRGGLAVGTDLGVVYLAKGSSTWQRLGGSSLPVTVAMQVKVQPGPSNVPYLYVATHGRGLWRADVSGL